MGTYTTVDGYIEITHCDTAREFLDYLKISDPRWLPATATSSPWIFRGQRKADWLLVPRAHRSDCDWFDGVKVSSRDELKHLLLNDKKLQSQPNRRKRNQIEEFEPQSDTLFELLLQEYAERYAVEEFIVLADRVGHTVPEDKRLATYEATVQAAITSFLQHRDSEKPYWFDCEGIEFSLAQHHGIPTRLLDWTFNPNAAAFFAAEEVVNTDSTEKYCIAVWAVDRSRMEEFTDLKFVTQRRAKISYLNAQDGVFIYDCQASWYFIRNHRWRSFDEAIASIVKTAQPPLLRKATLPATEALELLRLLGAQDVTRARLMPTFDNITEALRMTRRINRRSAKANKPLEYYLSLRYTIEIIPDEDAWFAQIKELPGCMTEVDEWDEILPAIEEAKRLWLEVSLEHGDPIPEPEGLKA